MDLETRLKPDWPRPHDKKLEVASRDRSAFSTSFQPVSGGRSRLLESEETRAITELDYALGMRVTAETEQLRACGVEYLQGNFDGPLTEHAATQRLLPWREHPLSLQN